MEEFRTNIGDKSIRIVINVGKGGGKKSRDGSTKKMNVANGVRNAETHAP